MRTKFNISVPHQLDRDSAVSKLKRFADNIREDMNNQVSEISESWDEHGNMEFSFTAMGFKVNGQLITNEEQVNVQGDLPFAALPFRGALESEMKKKILEAIS